VSPTPMLHMKTLKSSIDPVLSVNDRAREVRESAEAVLRNTRF